MSPVELFPIILGLSVLALWIGALAHCLTREPENSLEKLIWVIVIVGATVFGALLYLALRARRPGAAAGEVR